MCFFESPSTVAYNLKCFCLVHGTFIETTNSIDENGDVEDVIKFTSQMPDEACIACRGLYCMYHVLKSAVASTMCMYALGSPSEHLAMLEPTYG